MTKILLYLCRNRQRIAQAIYLVAAAIDICQTAVAPLRRGRRPARKARK